MALELILGFDASLLTDATISHCTDTFVTWINGLFSFPIDLPGTGACVIGCLQTAMLWSLYHLMAILLRTQSSDGVVLPDFAI